VALFGKNYQQFMNPLQASNLFFSFVIFSKFVFFSDCTGYVRMLLMHQEAIAKLTRDMKTTWKLKLVLLRFCRN